MIAMSNNQMRNACAMGRYGEQVQGERGDLLEQIDLETLSEMAESRGMRR